MEFDATLKALLEESPADWPMLIGQPRSEVELIDADISTLSGATDKVIRVQATPAWLLNIEFQSSPDETLPRRLHLYNTLLENRHELLVRSLVVLLSPRAKHANLTGLYQRQFPDEKEYLRFRYRVIRVWQLPAESLLQGGLGLLPLAPISDVPKAELPHVIERMKTRLRGREAGDQAGRLWTATYILLGLRYSEALADQLLEGVREMEESVTYQATIARGEAKGIRKTLLNQGRKRFGEPDAPVKAALDAITDVERLEQLSIRLLGANSWQELLDLPRS
jgi:predicted transposase YdaD